MNLLNVYNAFGALNALYKNENLTAREAYGIMKLRGALREDALFFSARRNDLLMRYGDADKENPGRYTFPDAERLTAFEAAVKELAETEAHVRCDPVPLRGDLTGVTPETLEALAGFVTVE